MGETYDWLGIVAKQHNEWVKIVKSLGEYNYHEDVVQEMYFTLIKYASAEKVIKDGKVRRGYIFMTLRSLVYQLYNKKKKINKVSLDDEDYHVQLPYENTLEEQEAYHKICLLIDDLSDEWSWYDRKIWRLYSRTDMSIRKLASETKISWVSIFNTLKNLKQEIRNEIKEDFDDYLNEDYERI